MNTFTQIFFHIIGMAWAFAYMAYYFTGWEWFDGAGNITTLHTGMLFMMWSELLGKKDG